MLLQTPQTDSPDLITPLATAAALTCFDMRPASGGMPHGTSEAIPDYSQVGRSSGGSSANFNRVDNAAMRR